MTRVVVADDIFALQYLKTAIGSDGRAKVVDRGQLPQPSDTVLAIMGEPVFSIRLGHAIHQDADLPDEVGLALRRAAERMYGLTRDGMESPDDPDLTPVEAVYGPIVHDNTAILFLDTDGQGASARLVAAMVGVLTDELSPLEVEAEISVPTDVPSLPGNNWLSSEERRAIPGSRS